MNRTILSVFLVMTMLAGSRAADVSKLPATRESQFFASLPVPVGDPTRWQWRSSVSARVIHALGWEGPLYAHRPRSAMPKSLDYPVSAKGPPPAVGNGHGGIVYLNWMTGLKILMDVSVDVTFHTDPKPPASLYLQLYDFPMIVPGNNIKVGQYFGFQYWFDENKKLKTQFIWSRWNTRDKANAWVADGGWIESAGYENDFIGIRYPYEWGKGTYTVHVMMRESDEVGTWYELRIYDHQKSSWMRVGRLRFPRTANGLPFLEDNGGSWVELLGTAKSSKDVEVFHVSFGGVYTCGRTVAARQVELRYSESAPNSDMTIDRDGRRVHLMYGGETRRITPAGKYPLRQEH